MSVGAHVTNADSLQVDLSLLLESLEDLVGLLVVARIDEAGHVFDLVRDLLALLVDVHFEGLLLLDHLASGGVLRLHVQSDLGVGLALGEA